MSRVILVGGRWDSDGGRPSKVFEQFAAGVQTVFDKVRLHNGGTLGRGELGKILGSGRLHDGDILFWMPDIPNEAEKTVEGIKTQHPRVFLVGSKRLDGRNIGLPEVIDRMLAVKMNLGVVIDRIDGRFFGRVIDPLGNCYAEGANFKGLGLAAAKRVKYLQSCTRVGSEQIGDQVVIRDDPFDEGFLGLIRDYAGEFDRLVPRPKQVSRFLGNAAFRCSHGFPAFRSGGLIFMSRRNVDKSGIGPESFVAVEPFRPYDAKVRYYGPSKPSVDTPINLLLFYHMPQINFLIHGHVYIEGAAMTERPVPCGAIEEFEEAGKLLLGRDYWGGPDDCNFFQLNLKGHGFIAGADNVGRLRGLKFRPRPELERSWPVEPA